MPESLYLPDTSVLITADANYYPLDRMAPFWDWLVEQGEAGFVKIPDAMYDEITDGTGRLTDWISQPHVRSCLVLEERVDRTLLNHVLAKAYGDPDEHEFLMMGKDPFLIAYALAGHSRIVVTKEVSKPSKKGGNRKIPDACDDCGVECIDDFEMYRRLNFRIP